MTTCWDHVSIHLGCHIGAVPDSFGCLPRPEQRLRTKTMQFKSTRIGMTLLDKFKDHNDTLREYEDWYDIS